MGHWRQPLKSICLGLLDALLPFRCAACGAMAPAGRVADPLLALLCPACRDSVRPVTTPVCRTCGRPFDGRGDDTHRCGRCLRRPPAPGRIRAAAVYDGALVPLIHQLKYRRAVHLAGAMGAWLEAALRRHWPPGDIDVVVPVPLHRRKLRRRGYNQAWLVARQALRGRPGDLRRDILNRVRDTPPQAGLDENRRRRNLDGAFAVAAPDAVAGRHVLVVDDVMTTGHTLSACADALSAAGARRVDALVMATTLRRIQ